MSDIRKIIIAVKQIGRERAEKFLKNNSEKLEGYVVCTPDELLNQLNDFCPDYIFFPHWSWIIPKGVYESYRCIVFHTADLPWGRGGTPIQNQIMDGIEFTKLCALQVVKEIDAGPVYLRRDFSLLGTADEIMLRGGEIIYNDMIPYIIEHNPTPIEQEGPIHTYKRRTPEQSEIKESMTLEKLYDHIRMLDGKGYPAAFISIGDMMFTFTRATLKENRIIADVTITIKGADNE